MAGFGVEELGKDWGLAFGAYALRRSVWRVMIFGKRVLYHFVGFNTLSAFCPLLEQRLCSFRRRMRYIHSRILPIDITATQGALMSNE
jgi:hypothetical protein